MPAANRNPRPAVLRNRYDRPGQHLAAKQGGHRPIDRIDYRVTKRRPQMHALPKITNPLRPRGRHTFMPPIRFRTKPYLRLSRSLSNALEELEVRYPDHRPSANTERKIRQMRRKPK
jgi:hypothetical protein